MTWMSVDDVSDAIKPPEPPRPWGAHRLYSDIVPAEIPGAILNPDEVEREGPLRRVRFTPRHVRPGETVPLPPISLTVPQTQAGQEIKVRWRLTSSGVDGWQDGEIAFPVADEPVEVAVPNG